MSSKQKIVLTAIISVLITTLVIGAMFFGVHKVLCPPQTPQNPGSTLLSEIQMYIDSLYLGEVDREEMYHGAAKGMTAALGDPYTKYYSPIEFEEFMNSTTGEYVGVGIVISATVETNELIVVLPYKSAPGDKAGLLPGDIIMEIDSVPYTGDQLDDAAATMRGSGLDNPKGTTVKLKIKRGEEVFEKTLTREEVHISTTESKMLENDIGYMRIISFDSDTDAEVANEIVKLEEQGMKKLIIDLRDNGGGDFNSAIGVAELFLDEGALITYTQGKDEKRDYYYAKSKLTDCEVIVLANGGSASASEVVLGALKNNSRTKYVVGTKTFGKGITQNLYGLSNGGGISVTVDRYYTPSGECIHDKGIEPDIVCQSGADADTLSTMLKYEEDLQLHKSIELFK